METDKRNQALQMLGQALHVARCVETRDERAWLYVQISYTLLKAGEHHRARELVEKCLRMMWGSDCRGWRGTLLRWAAWVLAELGDAERGWNLVRLSSEAISCRDVALSTQVRFLWRVGYWECALSLLPQMEDGDWRDRSLEEIATWQIERGEIDRAIQTASRMGTGDSKARALLRIAQVLWQTERHEEGERYLRESIRSAALIRDHWGRSLALEEIAVFLAKAGRKPQAKCLFAQSIDAARRIVVDEFPDQRSCCLHDIACSQAQVGYIHDALQTASSISDEQWRAYALSDIALQMAQHGKLWAAQRLWEQALRLGRARVEPFNRSSVLRTIAEAYAKAGYKKEARQLFEEAIREALGADEKSWEPEMLIKDVAVGQAEVGMLPDALRTARRLASNPYAYAGTLNAIAEVLLQSKEDEHE